MSSQTNLSTILALVTPGILQMIMEALGVNEKSAAALLYNSTLYAKLEDPETRLWRLSPTALYDLLIEELKTGSITNWPEEQG